MATATRSADPARLDYDQLRAHVLGAFRGEFKPVETPWSYRLGILLVTFVMLLLPTIYIGLIALTCYAVYYHAVHHTSMFNVQVRGRGMLFIVLAYLAPMIVGAILILFMLKPLFARPARQPRQRSLTRDGEPLLFEFVERICAAVRAPVPREIAVNADVNASAGFRRGWLSFLGSDLVLTIGMPLVAGLDMSQLAGVLAHEFGHFSQGAGMRLTYIIRSIVHWFQRVVYERDAWDEWLAETSGSLDLRFSWVLYLARFFVWLTRKILFGLMVVGHAVAGIMLRQMEFDADRYEARLAGSDTFERTARRLLVLNVANQGAQADLGAFYAEGRLGDNLPKLIMANVDQLPKNLLQKLNESIDESATGWFDTHPADRDRIASAHREQAAGVFRLNWPAETLFRNATDVSRKVTWDYFCSIFGSQLRPDELHPVDDLLRRQQVDIEGRKALNRYFQGQFSLSRAMKLPTVPQLTPELIPRADTAIRTARQTMIDSLPSYRAPARERTQCIQRFVESQQALSLRRAGVTPPALSFLEKNQTADPRQTSEQFEQRMKAIDEQLGVLDQWAARRLIASLSLLNTDVLTGKLPDCDRLRHQTQQLLPIARALLAALPQRQKLQVQHAVFAALLNSLEKNGQDEQFVTSVLDQSKAVQDLANALRAQFAGLPYPFDHAKSDMTIERFLLADPILDSSDIGSVYGGADAIIDNLGNLAVRCMGQLVWAAEQIEAAMGLPPLAEPPEESEE